MSEAPLVGDERGEVEIRFTVKALDGLLKAWNAGQVTWDGRRVTLSVEEYEPGKAYMVSTIEASGE